MSKLKLFGSTSHSFIQAAPTSSGETFTLPGEGASNPGLSGMYLSTPQSANSASILFTDVPEWARKITVMFQGVSLTSSGNVEIRLGTSSGVISSGYIASSTNQVGDPSDIVSATTHFLIYNLGSTQACSGHYTFTKLDSSAYIGSSVVKMDTNALRYSAGELTGVSGTIDRVEIAASSAYDAGQINVLYEG